MTQPTGGHLDAYVVYERDEAGVAYGVEVVTADGWDDALAQPPAVGAADVRVVRLRRGRAPGELPRWLRVEVAPVRVAEARASYGRAGRPAERTRTAAAPIGRALWRWSPHFREPGAGASEFLAAGATAVRHPLPAPADGRRRVALLVKFAEQDPELHAIAIATVAHGEAAVERWLRCRFGTPDAFADAVLIERIERAGRHEVADALRFLRAAEVRGGPCGRNSCGPHDAELRELALDRAALLEQASPWRFVEGGPLAGALAAVRGWRARYERAYARHYVDVVRERDALARELEGTRASVDALRRLDGIVALGPHVGGAAIVRWERALAALAALPAEPEPGAARTGNVLLGERPAPFVQVRAAATAVRAALDAQRERLARRLAQLELARADLPALDRLMEAIAAAELEGIERVLDDDLVAHIEAVLGSEPAAESPLRRVAARFPVVDAGSLEEAVDAFRAALAEAVAAARGGTVPLAL